MGFTADEVYALLNKKIKNSGGGGVSSWNDLTDKPFYTKREYAEIFFHFKTITNDGTFRLPTFAMVEGETYSVRYNSEKYECIAQDATDTLGSGEVPCVAIGDLGALLGGEGTGEPFIIVYGDLTRTGKNGVIGMDLSGSENVDISLDGVTDVYYPLDERYVPNEKVEIKLKLTSDVNELYSTAESFADIYNMIVAEKKTVVLVFEPTSANARGNRIYYYLQELSYDSMSFVSVSAGYVNAKNTFLFKKLTLVGIGDMTNSEWTLEKAQLETI